MTSSQSSIQQVYSRGIFHGLPVLPQNVTGLRAMVVGASGMSGQHMIDELAAHPQRWAAVYALSRSAPMFDIGSNVQHLPTDLSAEPEVVAKTLTEHNVQVDFVFFFAFLKLDPAYVRQNSKGANDNAAQLCEVNGNLLKTFLSALEIASIRPRRILLQTGLKWYGVHLGPISIPATESDPRVEIEPNFYYTQHDHLLEYCTKHPETTWNMTFPSWILGSVKGSDMTIFYPLAVYASIKRYLNEPLTFPGDTSAWDKSQLISSGVLDSIFHEWLVLDPTTAGEAFNIVDDSDFNWGKVWPLLASWFALKWQAPDEGAEYHEVEMPLKPRGYGPNGKVRYTFSIVQWAQRPDVQAAWKHLMNAHHLEKDPLVDPEKTFSSLHFSLTLSWSWAASMDKARKFGWHGHVDSIESIRAVFERFVRLKMIPPFFP